MKGHAQVLKIGGESKWIKPTGDNSRGLSFYVFAEFDVPVGEIYEMAPTVVAMECEVDLHKRPPFGALGFADEVHASLKGGAV